MLRLIENRIEKFRFTGWSSIFWLIEIEKFIFEVKLLELESESQRSFPQKKKNKLLPHFSIYHPYLEWFKMNAIVSINSSHRMLLFEPRPMPA